MSVTKRITLHQQVVPATVVVVLPLPRKSDRLSYRTTVLVSGRSEPLGRVLYPARRLAAYPYQSDHGSA